MMITAVRSRHILASVLAAGLVVPAAAGAQQRARVILRSGDSTFVRITVPDKALLDSLAALMRALDQTALGSREQVALRDRIDSLFATAFRTVGGRGVVTLGSRAVAAMPKGWVGMHVQAPMVPAGGGLVEYLNYPSVVSVDPESPAQRAGLAPGDVIVAYDGVDLRSHAVNIGELFRPEKSVSVTIIRDGETKRLELVAARAPDEVAVRRRQEAEAMRAEAAAVEMRRGVGVGGGGGAGRLGSQRVISFGAPLIFMTNGVFGVSLTNVNPELGRALKIEQGLLVIEAPATSPGYDAGLREGDVIVTAAGEPVESVRQLQRIVQLHAGDRSVDLKVVRDKKTRKIALTW